MAVEIPRAVFEMEESLMKVKALLHRLDKGEQLLEQAVRDRQMSRSSDLAKLFNKVAHEALDLLEDAAFMHEMMASGRTTVIDRKGRAATAVQFNPKEHRVVDLFTLKSMKRLEEVFGESEIVEFEIVP